MRAGAPPSRTVTLQWQSRDARRERNWSGGGLLVAENPVLAAIYLISRGALQRHLFTLPNCRRQIFEKYENGWRDGQHTGQCRVGIVRDAYLCVKMQRGAAESTCLAGQPELK